MSRCAPEVAVRRRPLRAAPTGAARTSGSAATTVGRAAVPRMATAQKYDDGRDYKGRQHMIRIVIAVDVVPGHEAEWEEQWRRLREVGSRGSGFRGAAVWCESRQPTGEWLVLQRDG